MQRGESHQMNPKTDISDISAFSLPTPHNRVIVNAPWLKGGALLPTHDQRHTHTHTRRQHVILVNDQLDAQFFFSYMFIANLYMFRALMCLSSGELIVSIRYLVYVTVCR